MTNSPTTYDTLFAPLDIRGKVTVPNRLAMAPMTTTAGEIDGRFSRQELAYLIRRAEAGVGLIISPACYCHKSGHAFERQVGCHSDDMLPPMEELAEGVRRHRAVSFLQIHHGGNAAKSAFTGQAPWAPSAVHNRRQTSELPHAMTETEIWEVIESFARGAARAKRAGFDGVELHGANTYLFQQFLSPFTNKRDDQWGCQSMENRCRFAREVVKAVRAEVGEDYPVAYRLSPEEEDPDGYSTYEAIDLLKQIVPLGVDIVHVSSWTYGTGLRDDWPDGSHPTKLVRDNLPADIPAIGVGGVWHPNDALRILSDGVEMAALGRALLLDANWATKVRDAHETAIRTKITTEAELQALEIPDRMRDYIRKWVFETV